MSNDNHALRVLRREFSIYHHVVERIIYRLLQFSSIHTHTIWSRSYPGVRRESLNRARQIGLGCLKYQIFRVNEL